VRLYLYWNISLFDCISINPPLAFYCILLHNSMANILCKGFGLIFFGEVTSYFTQVGLRTFESILMIRGEFSREKYLQL